MLRAFPFKIEVLFLESVIATHPRSFGREQDVFDPLHYLALLEQRPGAFEHTLPLRQWRKKWPETYEKLLLEVQKNKPDGQGIREFITILKLHQTYPANLVEQAIHLAVHSSMFSLDGVKYHLQQLLNPLPSATPLDLSFLPSWLILVASRLICRFTTNSWRPDNGTQSFTRNLSTPASPACCLPELPAICHRCCQKNLDYPRYLMALVEEEIHTREQSRIRHRVKDAHFPVLKEMADFDFSALPSLNKARILDLAG